MMSFWLSNRWCCLCVCRLCVCVCVFDALKRGEEEMGVISGGRQEREKKRAVRAYDGQLRKGQDADPCVVLLCVSCTTSVICCVCYGESGLR